MSRSVRATPVTAIAGLAVGVLVMSACSSSADQPGEEQAQTSPVDEPLVATYDGGMYVLDGRTLAVKHDIPLEGFLRVNPAGDDGHVLVTTSEGFRVLDAGTGSLTDETFIASDPGHVVPHGERTVLFADGSGEITAFDPHDLGDGMPPTETFRTPQPHHGVAVILSDGTLVHSIGDSDSRSGAVARDGDREVARSEECPGLHGEAVAADDAVVFGCETGALVYQRGAFTKTASPTPYGRIGNIKGHDSSPVALGDMKTDPDAELERPEQFALIDTAAGTLELVQLPKGVSYSFRSLGRGPRGEALVLGTDGKLYVVDPVTRAILKSLPVTGKWTEPVQWQDPRPTVFTRGEGVYVTDPANRQVHLVDLQRGVVAESVTLAQAPNELSGAVGHDH